MEGSKRQAQCNLKRCRTPSSAKPDRSWQIPGQREVSDVHDVRKVFVDGRGVDAGLREDVGGVVAGRDELDLDDARGDEFAHLEVAAFDMARTLTGLEVSFDSSTAPWLST